MKIYNCDVCGQLIYFENSQCLQCHTPLGYLPRLDNMSSLEHAHGVTYKALAPQAQGGLYKQCLNYHQEHVCNWMIPADDPSDFCLSCRLNDTIPNLSDPPNREYWHRLEVSKRRLVYSLIQLGLPLRNKDDDAQLGLAFDFLAEDRLPDLVETKKLLTGHNQGKITINIAEANDAVRERMRLDMNERYRTLLGHFRHEIGHYYWFLLVQPDPDLLAEYRQYFGNDEADYGEALSRYYADGPAAHWQTQFVSAYASAHPWEDWAESWAHYLHMVDTLETARSWGLVLKTDATSYGPSVGTDHHLQTFEEMKEQWLYLSSALNSLNRSMGMKDVYPFVWSAPVIEKLRFIQRVIAKSKQGAME